MNYRDNRDLNNRRIQELESTMINDVFRVRIKTKDARSVEEIERYGTYITGIKSIDKNAGNEMMVVYLSIDMMVEYFERGSDFGITSKNDIKRIYDVVDEYIRIWKVKCENSLHNEKPPIDKILKLERFAKVMFHYARHDVHGEQIISSKFLSTFTNSIFTAGVDLRKGPSVKEEKPKDELPEREDLDTFFKSRKIPKKTSYR